MAVRDTIAKLAQEYGDTFSISEVASLLGLTNKTAASYVSRWTQQGWLKKVQRGYYAIVPLEALDRDEPLENMWVIVPDLFAPGYVGGWSAAEHWDFTEQIFRDICIITEKKRVPRKKEILSISFCIYHFPFKTDFGLETIWVGHKKTYVSDPHRTILDMLFKPLVGAGIQHTIDCFRAYVKSKQFDPLKLVAYAKKMGNGVVFKRLGLLSEIFLGRDHDLTQICLREITKGPSFMDPSNKSGKLVSRWNLIVPEQLQF